MSPFDFLAFILLLAAAIGVLNESTARLPPAIALLLGSIAVSLLLLAVDASGVLPTRAWVRGVLDAADLPHVFLDGVLALLLFAGSLHASIRELRDNQRLIFSLATASVIISTGLFAGAIWLVCLLSGAQVPLAWCGVMGAILAPTDAVVVDTLLGRLPLSPRLRAAITGESLFNDGAGVVMFGIMVALAGGQRGLLGHGRVALALLAAGLGGAAVGAACGWFAGLLARRRADLALQVTISVALAISSYRLADALGVSGPIAVVSAGLALGRMVPSFSAQAGEASVAVAFWSMLDGLLNTMLFLLLGLQVVDLSYGRVALVPVLLAIPVAVATRLVSVAVPALLRRGRMRDKVGSMVVLTWAGLRGGVSVALALIVPDSPYRDQLLAICYAVVVFTIVVQGLTLPRVVERFARGR
ncbi:MAG: sodium:proton antiporter [Acetobacteraceae bacterium]|nr:sodium:proton antiporter [Acetobacteraceae bacterium]